MLKQRPATAKGVMFATLEDETGFIQCIISPQVQARYRQAILSPSFIVQGLLQGKRHWRAIVAQALYPFAGVCGGAAGFACSAGRDYTYVVAPAPGEPEPQIDGLRSPWQPAQQAAGTPG